MKQTIFTLILVLIFLTGYSQEYPVRYQLPERVNAKAGDRFSISATFKTNAPWYIYAPTGNNAIQGMIETNIIFQLPSGITRKCKMQLPEMHFKGGYEIYEGADIKFSQQFAVNKDLPPGEYNIHAKITCQSCNENICLPPISEEKDITVIVSGEWSMGNGEMESGKLKVENETSKDSMNKEQGTIKNDVILQFTALDGRKVNLEKLKGKLVLIDCWATWCRPCIAEFSNVKAMYDKYHAKGFEVIGISMDEAAAKQRVKEQVAKNKLPWPQGFEGKGFDNNSFVKQQNIASLPTVLLIDRNGNIVDRDARGERLEELIKKYLPVK